jgi:hypothetical protein
VTDALDSVSYRGRRAQSTDGHVPGGNGAAASHAAHAQELYADASDDEQEDFRVPSSLGAANEAQ